MPSFTMMGQVRLEERTGSELEAVLRQPKRLALLAYLALPRPGTWHRRDTLLSVFWPEADAGRGRTALRNALYVLRQHLDEGALRTRGDEEVSLDPEQFSTDVALLERELQAGNPASALARYTGELLPALHVPGAEAFEKWLDDERQRVLGMAQRAALALIEDRTAASDLAGAIDAAKRATELDPDGEPVLRRLMELMDRAGASTRALAVYEKFRARIQREYGTEPAPPTAALAERIRSHSGAALAQPPNAPLPSPVVEEAPEPPRPAVQVGYPRPRRARLILAASLGVILVVTGLAVRSFGGTHLANTERSILVLPMENTTGEPALDYLATGIAEDLAERLLRIRGLARVRSAARAEWPRKTRADLPLLGRTFGTELALRTRLARSGDSLTVSGEVVDLPTGNTRSLASLRFTEATVQELDSRLAAAVVGTAFRRPMPEDPRPSAKPVDPESYRLTLKGWQQQLGTPRNGAAATQLFTEATRLDPGNARAWAGISSARSADAVAWGAPFEEGSVLAEAAANHALALDSLQGTALANLAILRGLRDRNLAEADSLFARAIRAEPANPEIFLVQQSLYRHAWQWEKARDAIRVARQLDPLSALYTAREANLSLCEDRPDLALPLYEAVWRLDPATPSVPFEMARTLARLGRWDDALAAVGMNDLHGEAGYWQYRTTEARPRLTALLEVGKTRWVSRARLGTLYVAVGETDKGLEILEQEARKGDIGIYRLPCQPDVDRARDLPRFKALLDFARQTLPR